MKVKVCGMKFPENINNIRSYDPDYMGFIFYDQSPRYVSDTLLPENINFKEGPDKVGVFVNSKTDEVVEISAKYQLDFVQLHGDESVEYVEELFEKGIRIIKAFQIEPNFNWYSIHPYSKYVEYFLFDTSSKNYGGSGLKFDWKLLKHYQEPVPFFLSGGIGKEDIKYVLSLEINQLFAVDINSRVEIKPGLKNYDLVKETINQLRNESKISSRQ